MSGEATRTDPKPPPVDRASLLWRRINEHKLVQWSIAYVALAYAIQHAVILTSESFEWPNIVARVTMLLLVFGLPLVMVLAWYHGHNASRHVSKVEFSIITLLFAVGSLWFYVFVNPHEERATSTPSAQQGGVAQARRAAADPNSAISLAVLPFVNLSSDKEQEFFSDGMTEEITSALAKVSGLNVVARTSAFQFKGANKDMRAIGQALGASHLIEGSVRKDGNQIRITAQLIKADDGTHLWTESYDRELKGIFAVQEEIAQAIAGSLQVPLGLKKGDSLIANRIADTASYQDYLRARALVRLRGLKSLSDAADLLEHVVARDPGYAPAWALLALCRGLIPNYHPAWLSGDVAETRRVVNASLPRAEAAAQRAIALDPKLADGYEALGLSEAESGKVLEAEDLYLKALALDPNHPDTMHQYSQLLGEVGRIGEAVVMRQRLQTVEPLVPVYNSVTGAVLWVKGDNDAAARAFRSFPTDPVFGKIFPSMAYASMGRFGDAANTLAELPEHALNSIMSEAAIQLLHQAPAVRAPQGLPRLGILDFVYLYVGASSRVLEFQEAIADAGYLIPGSVFHLWHPSYAPVRKTERFRNLIYKTGIVDYWRAKGWPPQCHPTTGDDFACE